jgi:endoglucanase
MENTLLKISVKLFVTVIIAFGLLVSCSDESDNPLESIPENREDVEPFGQNQKLGKGINIGNAMEAPKEGDWGVILEEDFFRVIGEAGFNSVRIPVKWSAHALASFPYTIETSFFERIDWVIAEAFKYNLAIVINIHHYDEIMTDPNGNKERFLSLWDQISEHYKDYSYDLFFEILNEPNTSLTNTIWNQFLAEAISKIRETNPGRTLIVGGGSWNNINSLQALQIPADEKNIIATFHYYNPFEFTHQGADWVDGSEAWIGTKWQNTNAERDAIISDFDKAVSWSIQNNIPLNLGEFGAFSTADIDSRYLWTIFVSQLSTFKQISWHYWEFCSGFGVYNKDTHQWNQKLLSALIQ